MNELLFGRALLESELKGFPPPEDCVVIDGFLEGRCMRCGTLNINARAFIPCSCSNNCFYCTTCLQMGQVKSCSKMWHVKEKNNFSKITGDVLTWQGNLSKQQAGASKEIVQSIHNKETRLIWAVAGAGKTEMLFEGIAEAVSLGYRIGIASPRIDVCLELAPRIKQAFQEVSQITLYGDMDEDYAYTQIVISTTHQLLRFHQAFDVLIIDEIDAFPYYQNDALYFAAEKSRKENSALIYLTATPDTYLQKQVKQNKLLASILPARYHGFPLPVPKEKWAGNWQENLLKKPLKSPIVIHMQYLLKNNRRFLVFVPNIKWMETFEKVLQPIFSDYTFESVSSIDADRKEKVRSMREEKVDFLLTTTILERGVTFKNIDVIVIGAEDRTYTEAALVQIAGRAGRSPDFPTGDVTFFHFGKSQAMNKAIKQIKTMNKLAKERGLLHG